MSKSIKKLKVHFSFLLVVTIQMTSSVMETLLGEGEEGEKILVHSWIISVSPRVASYNCETFFMHNYG